MPYFGRRGRQRRSNFFRKNVNLPLYKLPVVCYTISRSRGISAAGSAQHWQCWGQRFESAMLHQNKSESVCRFGFFAFSTDAHIKKAGGVGATLPAQGMGDAGGGYGPSLDRGLLLPSLCRRRRFRACGRDQRAFRSPFGSLRSSYLVRAFVSQDAGRLFFGVSA